MPQDRAQRPAPAPPPPSSGSGGDADARSNALGGGTYFLGRYRVVDEIGVGGMASVHLARMDGPGGFQKWVAIKRIHPHLVEDETFVNMFLDEARVAARISHPNVATVFELGKHEDTYWIAMEYLHGEPLREVMRRTEDLGQPMPPEIACRSIADAAEGLHAAHELLGRNGEKLGLVHRDVTPHNLFVTYDGCTKVVDFGIAKFNSRTASTRAGTLKGKLAYMSPEQVAGESIDRRTDVFALGVVLWELTTGQRLFRMDNDLDTLAKVQECLVPRPSSIVRGYPIDLEKIVMKALAKNRNERYRTARELSRALQSLLMRRGLFIASDEVASYMTTIFGDRIQKREAHLRWAAEVTQTIDIDKMKALEPSPWRPDDDSLITYNSEVQASQGATARGAPRPAAGARAAEPRSPPTSGIPTPVAGPVPRALADLKATVPLPISAPPTPAPRPAALSRPVDPLRGDDAPTVARPRKPREDEDDDDNFDTIVSDSPEVAELRAAHMRGPLGPSDTQAASPAAMAIQSAPRPAPARQPTQPSMPAVMVPSMQPAGRPPYSGPMRPDLPPQSYPPRQTTRSSLSSEYAAPSAVGPVVGGEGPPDLQRLFAPPQLTQQRTVTAQNRKNQVPVLAILATSGVLGLAAFLIVLTLMSRPSNPAGRPPSSGSAVPSAGVPAPGVASMGPFGSARSQFAAAVGRPGRTDNDVAPAPGRVPSPVAAPADGPSPPAASPPSPQGAEPPPIPTANVAALPRAATQRGPIAYRAPAAAPPAPAAPPAGDGTTGTLKVICVPGCDKVFDNGAPLGPSPVVSRNATLGSHRVTLMWNDVSIVKSAIVLANETAVVRESRP